MLYTLFFDYLQSGTSGRDPHFSEMLVKSWPGESVPVEGELEGEPVWEGVVQVFEIDHPKSKLCYAWSYGLDNSKKRRFFAVLHQRAINSPQAAVRAAIVSEFRK